MMAAYAAAESGHAVTLLEQNEKLGKKLFITGKGRCNLTNASDMEQLFANVVSNRKFLYSAFYSYDNEQVISFFESHGMPTKTERGNRVFPVSDHSSDVIAALSTALRGQHVEVFLHTKVKRLLLEKRDEEKRVTGVELADHTKMHADAVIVATGGISYPSTGATGDGYRMAEESGHAVTLLEQNEKLGKKLFITGKGRCNLTNASDMEQLFANVVSNRKFLYSAFYSYDNEQVISFFESHGMPTKTERGNRVFPVSDHSSDVIAALSTALRGQHVEVFLHTKVKRLLLEKRDEEKRVTGVELADHTKMHADAVIVATGGISYPSTGATGDGYRMAEESGHKMVSPTPALVPMEMKEPWVRDLQGLSLRNVRMSVTRGKKKLYEDFGEMLFTHFGVSGPLVLSASGCIPAKAFDQELSMTIDLKPALDVEQLDHRILREFDEMKNKQFKNSLGHLLPAKMIPVMIALSGIDPDTKVNEISREQRQNLLHLFKNMPLTITGLRDFKEAIITKGGVSVKDINPSTMESKLVQGLYFCGEVLDLDALTGGYNLQIAWSTGHLAGISVL